MALSADLARPFETGPINTHPVSLASTIYRGSAVGLSGGYARALTAGDTFAGFANAKAVAVLAGSVNVDVVTRGLVQVTLASVAISDVGNAVYMSDDGTFTQTKGSNSFVGNVYRYVTTNTCVVAFLAQGLPEGEIAAGGTLASGEVLVGNGSNVAAAVALSGDVTVNNSGVTAIGAAKVLTAMISAGQVTAAALGTAAVTSTKISDATITIGKLESVCLSTLISYSANKAASAVTSHVSSSAH